MTKPCKRGHTGPRYASGACIECARDRYQANRQEHIDRASKRQRRVYVPHGPAGRKPIEPGVRRATKPEWRMFWGAQARARAAGLPFDLTIEDIVIPDVCPVFGTAMVKPQLDRKVNERGYVRGNVFVISGRANRLKSDANAEELAKILAYLKSD